MSINSRTKGKTGEYLVRNYFRSRGWVADRVPGSGAYHFSTQDTDLKGDVVITKDGVELRAEVKFRKDCFKSIYALMDKYQTLGLKIEEELVMLSFDFDNLGLVPALDSMKFLHVSSPGRTHKKLVNLKKLLKGADFLVIKINHKPLLFLRFWS